MRYVLLSKASDITKDEIENLVRNFGIKVLDHVSGKSALIEATDETAERLRQSHPGWIVSVEKLYPRPEVPDQAFNDRRLDDQ